ncbi:unnamed protein product [Dovyalis caffra]|uniref:Uncharacterized protein n=1 Tax=Dovyalis caffra TaxID=77055 RepID=A0AAV1RP91_9ROSI|nr:unnamed protein product [Dovyalis caffra]
MDGPAVVELYININSGPGNNPGSRGFIGQRKRDQPWSAGQLWLETWSDRDCGSDHGLNDTLWHQLGQEQSLKSHAKFSDSLIEAHFLKIGYFTHLKNNEKGHLQTGKSR